MIRELDGGLLIEHEGTFLMVKKGSGGVKLVQGHSSDGDEGFIGQMSMVLDPSEVEQLSGLLLAYEYNAKRAERKYQGEKADIRKFLEGM